MAWGESTNPWENEWEVDENGNITPASNNASTWENLGGNNDDWAVATGNSQTPGAGGAGASGNSGPATSWQNLVNEYYGQIQGYTPPAYQTQLEGLTQKWLDPNYKAYSDKQLQDWYSQGKAQLEGDIFNQWDAAYGRSMANQGLTGSGVAGLNMGKILGQKGGALADLWGGIQKYGDEATRADRAAAASYVPMLSQLNNLPQEMRMQLLNILTSDRTGQRQQDSSNAAGIGTAIAGILGALI
jgi:hypothetical protein